MQLESATGPRALRHACVLAVVGLCVLMGPNVAGVLAATYKVTKKWIWVIGGIEYCVFWMLCCIALAMLTWPK